jgi:hypothetical protein
VARVEEVSCADVEEDDIGIAEKVVEANLVSVAIRKREALEAIPDLRPVGAAGVAKVARCLAQGALERRCGGLKLSVLGRGSGSACDEKGER